MKPKVSAMVLTRNRKNWLRETIKGILNQTYKNFELIIIDNASTDGTKEMVKKEFDDERITYIRNKKNFYPDAYNQRISLAKGEYIALCDDDDISLPERFEKSVEFLEKNPDVAMIGGGVIHIDKKGEEIRRYKYPAKPTFEMIYGSNAMISCPSVMMRKKIVEEIGGFDTNFNIALDYDLWLRIAKKHKIRNLDCFLSKYRLHGKNISLDKISTIIETERVRLKWAKASCLCFSKDRVFQLESYIQSFIIFVKGVQLNVIYKSEEKYKEGYEKLKEKYPEVNFIEETNFKEQVMEWLNKAPDIIMFGCDDFIFKDYVDIEKVIEKVKMPNTIGFSLNLGRGLTHNFYTDRSMKEPEYEESNGILKWKWREIKEDYGYPFSLSASVYKKEFVEFVINSFDWVHPNNIEGRGDVFVRQSGEKCGEYLYAFSEPKALGIQINRVQNEYPNRFYDTGYDIETLFNLWKRGKRLDLNYYHNKKFNCIYVEDFVLEGEDRIKVSVIIPIYNQKKVYFEQCIQSIIDQTRKPDEIIIVDDKSDPPLEFALPDTKKIPIKIIRNKKNMGIGYSRKKGADEATGDYITFLSSDDIWDKKFLEIMIRTVKQHPEKILYSKFFQIGKESKIIKEVSSLSYEYEDFCIACWNSAYKDKMFVNFSTTFIPKEVFEKVKFDENLRFGEDLDFLLRSMKHFEYYLVNQPIVYYRIEDNLTSRIFDKIPKNNEKIREKCMEYWKNEK